MPVFSSRMSVSRRYRRLLRSIQYLREHALISRRDEQGMRLRIEKLRTAWRKKWLASRGPVRPRGRPRNAPPKRVQCAYAPGCRKDAAPGQKYCSAEHAPCARFMVSRYDFGAEE